MRNGAIDGITWSGPNTIATGQNPGHTVEWDGTNYVVGLQNNTSTNTFPQNTNISSSVSGSGGWTFAATSHEGTIWSIVAVNGKTMAVGRSGVIITE